MAYKRGDPENQKYAREYARRWYAAHPEYKEHRKKYRSQRRKERAAYNKKWYRANREKAQLRHKARWAVLICVELGFLTKPEFCAHCGERKTLEGHHHNGYEKAHWLDVIWLCRACHCKVRPAVYIRHNLG